MSALWLRPARDTDEAAIASLDRAAFGRDAEAQIAAALRQDGESLSSLIAHDDHAICGHLEFFRVQIEGAAVAAGLGPLAVAPAFQRRGTGSQMVRFGLAQMQGQGHDLVFVHGAPEFFSRFGFSARTADGFSAPWSGPRFMALRLDESAPRTGQLAFPRAIGRLG